MKMNTYHSSLLLIMREEKVSKSSTEYDLGALLIDRCSMTDVKLRDFQIRDGLEGLTPERIMTLYRRAPLHRSVGGAAKVWSMFEKSSLVLTAWYGDHLIGIARVLSDGAIYSYLCDLAVEPDVQRLGVGRALIKELLKRCKGTEVILRDSDISSGFYAQLGFKRVENAWMLKA